MSETILLVDDNAGLRDLLAPTLRFCGYTVLEAESGEQARHVFDRHDGRIDLLVCDIVMPGMSGPQLAETLILSAPAMRLLFISGYQLALESFPVRVSVAADFLQKPFTLKRLVDRVERSLAN
jgi:two-component system, cell cycle sensor histidine kinase and response regulator CckA